MSGILTSSRLSCARACQRLHHIKYDLGYRPVEDAAALRFGTLVHKGLEAWWRSGGDRLFDAYAALLPCEAGAFDIVRAEEMLRGYHFRWIEEMEHFEVLGVEVEFSMPLKNPATGKASRNWTLAGKLDAIVRDRRTGRVLVVEHKTASGDIDPGSEYFKRLRMDAQVSVYFDGGSSLGHDVSGCLYDVLGKSMLRPSKATPADKRKFTKAGELYAGQRLVDETPEEFRLRLREAIAEDPSGHYQRGEVVRLDSEMEDARFDVWQVAQGLRESELAGRFPRNPDSCLKFGRTCVFWPVCTGEASLDDLSKYVRNDNVHPELAEVAHAKEG